MNDQVWALAGADEKGFCANRRVDMDVNELEVSYVLN